MATMAHEPATKATKGSSKMKNHNAEKAQPYNAKIIGSMRETLAGMTVAPQSVGGKKFGRLGPAARGVGRTNGMISH